MTTISKIRLKGHSVLKLYTKEGLNHAAAQSSSNLTANEIKPSLHGSPSMNAEKEKQLFSPSTKKVIEEITLTAAMDKGTMLPCPSTKRGIVFTDISGENQDVLLSQIVPSPAEETVAPTLGSESPVKKLKNKYPEEQSYH